jgi:large subunit ribosomal protein LP0
MRNKIGLIFTDTPVYELKEIIENNRVAAVARPGIVAPISVNVPVGPTGLDPS